MNTSMQTARQDGFVLITSLIFLVVVTLLAVTAINRSTLQEKIATNMRARENAQQYADAALRKAETILRTDAFETYQSAGQKITLVNIPAAEQEVTPDSIRIWHQGAMLPSTDKSAEAFLLSSVWESKSPAPYKTDKDTPPASYYFIEELAGCYQADLNPDACATGSGAVIYRITARAKQGSATVVTQSTFAKYY